MTQTSDNNSSSNRLDRIEAVLEQIVVDRQADRQETSELRSSLTELSSSLAQLTRRVDNLVERQGRYEEQNQYNISELVRGQSLMTQVIRHLSEGQAEMAQTMAQSQARFETTIARIDETLASLAAGQERQERILDYLMRRVNGGGT